MFDELIAAGVPCGPINTIDDGVAFAERLGLDPVVDVGRGRRGGAVDPQPDHVLGDAGPATRCRRPALDEHGDEIRAWLADPPTPTRPSDDER